MIAAPKSGKNTVPAVAPRCFYLWELLVCNQLSDYAFMGIG